MKRDQAKRVLYNLVDVLAAIEHERWCHWQRYMHDQAIKQADGSLILPAHLVARWETQIRTDFESLTDKEKDSDREQVHKYLPLIVNALSSES
jgi:hypothetical protein